MRGIPIGGYSTLVLIGLATACANPAENKPEAVVTEVEEARADESTAEGVRLEFSEDSTLRFVGSKVTGKHDGGFEGFEGAIVLVDGDPTASRVEVQIDTTSLWADNDRLTGHLKSADFFDVENFPTARFESTSITAAPNGYEVTGNLELHGVTKQITFPATIDVQGDRVTVSAEFFIKRYDFGIEYPGKPDDLIRDEVVIRLDLTAVATGASAS
jgi:polyisoprenoid-binding protein YceI